jgi:hypothetical protein
VKLAALVIVLLGAGVARADGERALSAGFGWATYSALGKPVGKQAPPTLSPDVGGMLVASYEYAISADVALRGELAGGVFHGGNQAMQSAWSYASLGDAGAVFRFDVVKVVPYLFGGVGGVVSGGGPIDRGVDFVLVAGGGVDWLYSRERSIGAEVRIASFGGDITLATFGVRGTLRWGDL